MKDVQITLVQLHINKGLLLLVLLLFVSEGRKGVLVFPCDIWDKTKEVKERASVKSKELWSYQMQKCLGLEDCNLSCYIRIMQKSVLHECQKLPTFDQVRREFLMQDRHERDLSDSAMLGPAFQTSRVMENLHDKFTLFQTQTFLHFIGRREREKS